MRGNLVIALLGMLCVVACGGGGSSLSSGSGSGSGSGGTSNVQSVVLDSGPSLIANSSTPALNIIYTTVTICAPGSTTNCQTIDHIQVDTGSEGFRILANNAGFSLSLPLAQDSSGNTLAECVQFLDGYSFGPIHKADIKIAGETASNIDIQVIGDTSYTVPQPCISGASVNNPEDTVQQFGANGIIGVGPFVSDCGSTCTVPCNASTGVGCIYFSCPPGSTCTPTTVVETAQVSNPVSFFTTDNNGVIIQLPTVAAAGAASVTGSLIFGIGTESNNGLASGVNVFTIDDNGQFLTTFQGSPLSESVIDSGSNGYFFPSSITQCTDKSGFYCPGSTLSETATITGVDASGNPTSTSENVGFTVANEPNLNGSSLIAAYPGLAGAISTTNSSSGGDNPNQIFDWGVPFHFGRSVYTAIDGATAAGTMGPYFAF